MATNNSSNYSPVQFNVILGGAGGTITSQPPSATSGVPLVSQGASANPNFGTAVVAGGGTGNTTFTAFSVICAGTAATGPFQNVSGVGSSGQVLTSNGAAALPTWQGAVNSITGTANQINASASQGSITLSLSSTIITPGTLSVNGSLQSNSTTTLNATGPYNLSISGTQTTSTGSTFAQSGILIQSVLNGASNLFNVGGITNICRFIAPNAQTMTLASAYYASVNSSGNLGTITRLAHFYSDGFVAVGGTVSNVYGFYAADPGTGSASIAAYFANLSVGYPTANLTGTTNAIFIGNVSVGSTSASALFNVGSSNQFQINSSGVASGPQFNLNGSSSGIISILPQAAAGTFNFNLPTTAGSSGQLLTSGGGGASPMTWSSIGSIAVSSITGTANQITASASIGAVTLSFPATGGISIGSYQATTPPSGGLLMPGNLLIGTTTPASTSTIYAVVPDATFGTATSFILSATSGGNTFQLRGGVSATNSYAWLGSTQSGVSARPLYLYGTPGVGINVVPLSALDVNGGVAIGSYAGISTPPSNSLIISGIISIGSASPASGADLYVSSSGNTESWVNAPAANLSNRIWSKDGLAKWQMYVPVSSNDIRLFDSADRVTFQSGGNVGIATTIPKNKLDINGSLAVGSSYAGVVTAPANSIICSGIIAVASGTSSAPGFTFFTDNTTGLYYTSTQVNVTTGGTLRALINSSGIVIANPGSLYTNSGTSSGGSLHWILRNSSSVIRFGLGLQIEETGSNAGANFNIYTYSDGGGFLGNPITIIRSSGTVGINTGNSANTSSVLNSVSTLAYNYLLNGTQSAVDGSSISATIYLNPTLQPTNGSTISSAIYNNPLLNSPSTKTISAACGFYLSTNTSSNAGTITTLYGINITGGTTTVAGTITNAYNLFVSQPLSSSTGNYYAASIQGGLVFKRTATAADYTVKTSDYIVGVTSTAAAITITLPATAPDAGWSCIVKDESNAAATNNITISRNGRNINNTAANLTINTNSGVFRIYSDGSNYFTW